MASDFGAWEPVVGLEVHAQLLTRSKAFCGCATSFGDPPNTHTCPVCLGLPGSLPVLNAEAVRMAALAALALGCTVHETSIFARKNYFYPDLPKGYQISQYDRPLATKGVLEIETEGAKLRAGITRVHMEEDAGKNLHGIGAESVVDLNRAGTPLIEIVGEPDLRSGAQAGEYLKRLRELLMFLGVNDGNLEQGSFRCDANVSVRKKGETKLGTRTELKNINSFRFVSDAIDLEVRRQIEMIERGERIRQQTRGYNADKRETYLLRDKENEAGYRYFPEPDLPPLVVDAAALATVRGTLPELPAEKRRRYVEVLGLPPVAAGVLTSHPRIAAFFEEALRLYTAGDAPKTPSAASEAVRVANFVQSEVLRDLHSTGIDATLPVTPAQIAELLHLVDRGTVSGKQGKEIYAAIAGTTKSPGDIVKERNMAVLSDASALEAIAREIIEANAKQAAAYRAGKTALLGFFVGQMMKKTSGSADPQVVNEVLRKLLGDPPAGPGAAPAPSVPPAASITAPPTSTGAATERDPETSRASNPPPTAPSPAHAPSPLGVGPIAPPKVSKTKPEADSGGAAPAPPPKAEVPATIPYDTFASLDLRVGLIVAASRVPRKDKLLDLRVDTGDAEPRRIVAGLALTFAPEALVGRRVVVVCNLEPRAFSKELVSHGMILAAGPSEALVLATVSGDAPAGTRVK